MLKLIAPPVPNVTDMTRDIDKNMYQKWLKDEDIEAKNFEIWKDVPIVGKLYYW